MNNTKRLAMTDSFSIAIEITTDEDEAFMNSETSMAGLVLSDYTGRQYMLVHKNNTQDEVVKHLIKAGWDIPEWTE